MNGRDLTLICMRMDEAPAVQAPDSYCTMVAYEGADVHDQIARHVSYILVLNSFEF